MTRGAGALTGLLALGVLLVVGGAGVLLFAAGDASDVGWFAYAPVEADVSVSGGYVMPRSEVAAWAALWVGSLLLAGAAGWWTASRRLSR